MRHLRKSTRRFKCADVESHEIPTEMEAIFAAIQNENIKQAEQDPEYRKSLLLEQELRDLAFICR